MGVGEAPTDFAARAVERIRTCVGDVRPAAPGGAGVDTTRVFAYAEYATTRVSVGEGASSPVDRAPQPGSASRVDGCLFQELGQNIAHQIAHK